MISQVEASIALASGAAFDMTEATVVLDEGHAPFARATVTLPYSADTADALDPRTHPRVRLTLGQRFAGSQPVSAWVGVLASDVTTAYSGLTAADLTVTFGTPWNAFGFSRTPTSRLLDLGVRSRVVNHADDTITLVASSDEMRLQDYGLLATAPAVPPSLTVLSAVQLALGTILPSAVLTTSTGSQAITADSAPWQPGTSAWDYLTPLVTSAGLRLWCDEVGGWHLDDPATITAPGQVTLSTTGTVTQASDTIDRDSDAWADAVVVRYTQADGSSAWDVAGDPGTATRTLYVEHTTPMPRAGEAQTRLNKLAGRGRVLDVSAVVDLTAYPAMAAMLTLPDSPAQAGAVSAVEWRIPDDEMTVTTRDLTDTPETAWTFGPAGTSWAGVAPGTSWDLFAW